MIIMSEYWLVFNLFPWKWFWVFGNEKFLAPHPKLFICYAPGGSGGKKGEKRRKFAVVPEAKGALSHEKKKKKYKSEKKKKI